MIEAIWLFCRARGRRMGSAVDADFTLIEVLLLVTLIGLLAGRMGPRVLPRARHFL
jgi:hypothetical protein